MEDLDEDELIALSEPLDHESPRVDVAICRNLPPVSAGCDLTSFMVLSLPRNTHPRYSYVAVWTSNEAEGVFWAPLTEKTVFQIQDVIEQEVDDLVDTLIDTKAVTGASFLFPQPAVAWHSRMLARRQNGELKTEVEEMAELKATRPDLMQSSAVAVVRPPGIQAA